MLSYIIIYNAFNFSARAIKASSALLATCAEVFSEICFGCTHASGALGPQTASTPTVRRKPSCTMLYPFPESFKEPSPRLDTPGIQPARMLAANLSPGPWSPSMILARP